MAANKASLKSKSSSSTSKPISSIPKKRTQDDSHLPAISSPLNPAFKPLKAPDSGPVNRERRAKKDSLRKRESKGSIYPTDYSKTSSVQKKKQEEIEPGPIRYQLPKPRPTDFEAPRGPILTAYEEKTLEDGKSITYNETSDHVYNKRNFHYTHCIADPSFFSSRYYRQSETEPFETRLNFEDTASNMFLDSTAHHVMTDKGFRMAKANVAVSFGRWYYECKITSGMTKQKSSDDQTGDESPSGHVRMGWARREASLDAPVGFDAYSYGFRDVAGQKVHMSRPVDFFPGGESIIEGDVIGMEIKLPSEALHRKVVEGNYNPAVDLVDNEPTGMEAADIVRDRVAIRYKTHLYFEQLEYHSTKELEELMNPSPVVSATDGILPSRQKPGPTHPSIPLRTLPHSCIRVYKNGTLIGTAFQNLFAFLPPASRPSAQIGARVGFDDGMLGYYPAVSVFRGGAAELNFGPDFWYPPLDYEVDNNLNTFSSEQPARTLDRVRAVSERYDEQIAEDIVYDIIDEVQFWIKDGCLEAPALDDLVCSTAGTTSKADKTTAKGRKASTAPKS